MHVDNNHPLIAHTIMQLCLWPAICIRRVIESMGWVNCDAEFEKSTWVALQKAIHHVDNMIMY